MSVLDELRDLIATEDDEELPGREEIAERRREVKAEISELEDRLRYLESPRGSGEALREADRPEDLGRKLRQTRDRLEGLRALDEQLAERLRAAKAREREEELNEIVSDLPDLADEFVEAEAVLREARKALGEALVESQNLHRRVRRKGNDDAPTVHLSDETVDRLERIGERLPTNLGHTGLDHLRPPEPPPDPDRPRIVYDVGEGVRHFVGDFTRSAEHSHPGRPRWSGESGWESDYSEAEGIG